MKFFDHDFTKEDLILYVFSFVLVGLFWIYLIHNGDIDRSTNRMAPWQHVASDRAETVFIKAQLSIIDMRYEQAYMALVSIQHRRNLGFLIGTMITLLGCVMIIRGIRNEPIKAELQALEKAKIKIITSSPGVLICLLGTIVIVTTLIASDHVDVQDNGISIPSVLRGQNEGQTTTKDDIKIDPAIVKDIWK